MVSSWISRFGLTWASGMVLVTASVQSFIDSVTPTVQDTPSHLEATVMSTAAQPATDRMLVELMGPQDGDAVEVRVGNCTDEPIQLMRHGVRFPIAISGVDLGEQCVLQARRRDGRFWTGWTEPVRVQGATTVGIMLPAQRAGGIGLVVSRRHQGAYVEDVEHFTPASRSGLEKGDIVSHVDGRSLEGMSLEDMVEIITGAEGTSPALSIIDVRTGTTVSRTIQREYMLLP